MVDLGGMRVQLERIASSDAFRRSARASEFLHFVVERILEGRAKDLKEYVIALPLGGLRTTILRRMPRCPHLVGAAACARVLLVEDNEI